MFTTPFYINSPIWLQNVILSVRAQFRKKLRENTKSEVMLGSLQKLEKSEFELKKYSGERLREAIKNAILHVPYYKKEADIKNVSLEAFPYIDKENLINCPLGFKSEVKPQLIVKGSTSGTTGTSISIPQSLESVIREQAFISRHLKWAGFEKGDRRAWIRGDMVVPVKQKEPPFWRYSRFENMIYLSSFHMMKETFGLYIQAMTDYDVNIIIAYPSSIAMLAKYLDFNDEYYPGKIKSVITSSEVLFPEDRIVIEKRFRCKVFDWYGQFERVAAIANCEHGRYHVLTDYSHVEFSEVGDGRYEIIGTNYNNHVYPLVRYKTGDYVVLSKETECPCGRVYPMVESIEGRVGDYLVGEDGQKVHILNHIPKGVKGLLACQFIQDSPLNIEVFAVVVPTAFNDQQQQLLVKNVKDRLGQRVAVKVVRVDALQRTRNGKVRQAVCSIKDII
jgi:phenylacetate-CoA ligase